jgi:hypothetical protein
MFFEYSWREIWYYYSIRLELEVWIRMILIFNFSSNLKQDRCARAFPHYVLLLVKNDRSFSNLLEV